MRVAAPSAGDRGVILAASVFCFAFVLALFPLQSYDTWWHLANGREIAQGRGIPRTNLYSFTAPDYEVVPTHWLFGLGAYCLHSVAGVNGLVVAKALIVAAAFTLALVLARRRGAGALAAAAVVALGVVASRRRFLERPHIFTMLGLAGFAYLLELFRERFAENSGENAEGPSLDGSAWRALGHAMTRRYWPVLALPPLAALWANLHAGCLFGVGLVGFAAAGEFVIWLACRVKLGPEAPGTRAAARVTLVLGAAALACAVFVMISPAGWTVYTYNLWHVGLAEVVPLKEFRAATPAGQPLFYLLVVAGAAALIIDRRRTRAGDAMAFGVFALLGIYAVRGIPNFALIAPAIMAPALTRLWAKARAHPRVARAAHVLDRLPQSALSLSLIVIPFAASLTSGKYRIALGVERGLVPEGAAAFVEREVAPERAVFNDLAAGGYLAWRWYPRRRIFIDGRTNAYPRKLFQNLYKPPVESAAVDRVLRNHDISIVILFHYGKGNPLWQFFGLDDWAVVYADETALVLAWRVAVNRGLIEKHEPHLGARSQEVLSRRLAQRARDDAWLAARATSRAEEHERTADLCAERGQDEDAASARERARIQRVVAMDLIERGRKSNLEAARAAERALKAEAASGARLFSDRRRAALRSRAGAGASLTGESDAEP